MTQNYIRELRDDIVQQISDALGRAPVKPVALHMGVDSWRKLLAAADALTVFRIDDPRFSRRFMGLPIEIDLPGNRKPEVEFHLR